MLRHKIVAAIVTEGDSAIVPEIDTMAKCVRSEAIIDDQVGVLRYLIAEFLS